jgi:hypothetical protein
LSNLTITDFCPFGKLSSEVLLGLGLINVGFGLVGSFSMGRSLKYSKKSVHS